jgi:hypothetical protein
MKLSPVTRMACCHSELNPKPTVEVDIGSPNLFQILNIIIEAITENSHSLPTIPAKKQTDLNFVQVEFAQNQFLVQWQQMSIP